MTASRSTPGGNRSRGTCVTSPYISTSTSLTTLALLSADCLASDVCSTIRVSEHAWMVPGCGH
eukprot:13714-Eustigmatos_ZCMA.PRE.1